MAKSTVPDTNENYTTGFIRMYRSVANKGWYKKSEYVHLWVHLLTKATREPFEAMFDGKNILLKPGQFITGRKALEMETGINESKIERILTFFSKNEQQIEQQKSTKNRLISIMNWHLYQYVEKGEQRFEQQVNNKRTTSEQQVNTNNKLDNIDKKDIYAVFLELFNQHSGKKTRVLCAKTRKQLPARYKEGFTNEDFIEAIKNCKADEYHIQNPKYLTTEFITRAEKLEMYLGAKATGQVIDIFAHAIGTSR